MVVWTHVGARRVGSVCIDATVWLQVSPSQTRCATGMLHMTPIGLDEPGFRRGAAVIRRQIVLPADPRRVWRALTDPSVASRWFGGRVDWDLHEGAALRFHDDDGSERVGRIDVVRPERYLRYTWWVQPGTADESGDEEGTASEVSYLLEEAADGTRLTIQEQIIPLTDSARLEPRPSHDSQASTPARGSDGWTQWDSVMVGV